MVARNDDFEWLLERLELRRDRSRLKNRTYWRERIETAEGFNERKRKRPSTLLIILQLLPFLVVILLFLLR